VHDFPGKRIKPYQTTNFKQSSLSFCPQIGCDNCARWFHSTYINLTQKKVQRAIHSTSWKAPCCNNIKEKKFVLTNYTSAKNQMWGIKNSWVSLPKFPETHDSKFKSTLFAEPRTESCIYIWRTDCSLWFRTRFRISVLISGGSRPGILGVSQIFKEITTVWNCFILLIQEPFETGPRVGLIFHKLHISRIFTKCIWKV